MGRGGYDTTYVCNDKNSAAADVIAIVNHQRAQNAEALERAAAAALEAKHIKNKRSRGIRATQRAAAAEQAAANASAEAQSGTQASGAGTKR